MGDDDTGASERWLESFARMLLLRIITSISVPFGMPGACIMYDEVFNLHVLRVDLYMIFLLMCDLGTI